MARQKLFQRGQDGIIVTLTIPDRKETTLESVRWLPACLQRHGDRPEMEGDHILIAIDNTGQR